MSLVIYGKPSCGFCVKAKRFAEGRNLTYEYKDVTVQTFMDELKEAYAEARSVPQIFVNGERVGGYQDFVTYVEDTGYTQSGSSL